MTHLWPSTVWTSASSTLKPGWEPAAWEWTRPWSPDNSYYLGLHDPTKSQVMWLGSGQQLAKVDTDEVSLLASRVHVLDAAWNLRRHLWQPAVDVSTDFSRVSYWLLPAASDCSMPVWGRRQNPNPGFHHYSAGLLQLAVLRHWNRTSEELQSCTAFVADANNDEPAEKTDQTINYTAGGVCVGEPVCATVVPAR